MNPSASSGLAPSTGSGLAPSTGSGLAVPRNRYVLFLVIAVGGCLLDLVSKSWIFGRLGMPHHEPTFGFGTVCSG